MCGISSLWPSPANFTHNHGGYARFFFVIIFIVLQFKVCIYVVLNSLSIWWGNIMVSFNHKYVLEFSCDLQPKHSQAYSLVGDGHF